MAPANRTKAGTFKKGTSGNPSGRAKIPEDIKQAFKELTPKAIKTIEGILDDPGAKASDKLRASELILDRAWGKPIQQQEVVVDQSCGIVLMPEVLDERG